MKKINKYILWLLPVFGLFACEDEMGVYNSPENRLNFIYEPFTMADTVIPRTFVYDVETRVFDTVWLEVETMGYVEDHERSFALEQVKKGEGEQAVVGSIILLLMIRLLPIIIRFQREKIPYVFR